MSQEIASPRLEKWAAEEAELKAILQVDELPDQRITAVEWEDYAERLAGGDTDVKTEIVERRLRVAWCNAKATSRRLGSDETTLEEHFQHAVEGILDGMHTYDPAKHTSLRDRIDWGMFHSLETLVRTGSNEVPMPPEDVTRIAGESLDPDAIEEAAAAAIAAETLYRALKQLSARERRILELRYGLHGKGSFTQPEIAPLFDVGKQRIHQLEHRAIRKLRVLPEAQSLREPTQH